MSYQTITLPLVGGINTKTSDLINQPPQMLSVVNANYQTVGALSKSYGYDALNTAADDDTILNNGVALGSYQNELLQFNGSSLYSYSESIGEWANKGQCNSVKISSSQVAKQVGALGTPDCAAINNIAVYSYTAASGGIYLTVVDLATGLKFLSDQLLDNNATFSKCYTIGNIIWVACVDATEIRTYSINPYSPTQIDGPFAPISTLGPNQLFDVVPYSDTTALFAWSNLTNNVEFAFVTSSGYLGQTTNGWPDPVTTTELATGCISISLNTDNSQLFISYWNSTDFMKCFSYNTDFSGYVIPPSVLNGDPNTAIRTTSSYDDTNATWSAFYTYENVTPDDNYTYTSTVAIDGDVQTPLLLYRSLTLCGKSFRSGAHAYMLAAFYQNLQSSYFLIRDDGAIMCRALGLEAGSQQTPSTLPNAVLSASGVYFLPSLKLFDVLGLVAITADFNYPGLFLQAQVGNVDLIGGGLLKLYDGNTVTEHSFLQWPYFPAALVPSTTGGNMADGTYFYKAIYAWTDAQGNFYQSAQSVDLATAEITGGGGNGSMKVTVSTLRVTQKENVSIQIFRADAIDSANYRLTKTLVNDPTVDSIQFTDPNSDAAIKSNTLLYVDTGELDNDAPPPCTSLVFGKTRIFLVNDVDGSLWYSKPFVPGFGIGFSAYQTISIDGFQATGVGIIDDKVIEFNPRQTYWFTGDGPNSAGQNGSFYPPQILTTDIGCTNPASIAFGPDGLYFQSAKGIMLIDRQLQSNYIGAPVSFWNNKTVTAATLVPDLNQMQFLTLDGPCLVYDYFVQNWCVLDNHTGYDAVVWKGVYTYLTPYGTVLKQNRTSYLINGETYNLSFSTAWLNLGQIQGYKRIKRLSFLGTYYGPCTVRVRLFYDYNNNFYDEFTWDVDAALDIQTFGTGTYGDGIYGTTSNNVPQWEIIVPEPSCQAIRVEFSDVYNSGNSVSVSAIDFECMVIGGVARLPATQVLGG